MKASYRWLRELLPDLTASPREVAAHFTGAGLEVEAVSPFGAASDSCVVVAVKAVAAHPSKSGLRLVTVDRGGGDQVVVCGAPNVPEPGGLVVLAPLGAHLPAKGLTIARRAIGGVESEGMLCSESELGLGDDEGGILVLPDGAAKPGTPLGRAIPNASDTIFDIGLPANRSDGLGHVGLARELAAIIGLRFAPSHRFAPGGSGPAIGDVVTITVDDRERCPHYGAALVNSVTLAPSPLTWRYRLQALGVRSISNVVDITNLVMLEYGHPMHAFDLEHVKGSRVHVRRAKEGEKLATLDGTTRTLVADDLVICDAGGPVALAGVMGGASSEIRPSTRRVLFECAWFEPRGVRRSARRHGLHTESSHRFERGVDPADVSYVLDSAVALTVELAGGTPATGRLHVVGGEVTDEPPRPARRVVTLRAEKIRSVLGLDVPFTEGAEILERLGCEVDAGTEASCVVRLPTHRPDLTREVDLVEEVLRLHGIDKVPTELPAVRASRDVGGREELARRAREVGVSLGLSEAITYAFVSERTLTALRAPTPAVRLKNPLNEHQSVMRTTLLGGLVDAVEGARRHGERDVREFTVGPVFLASRGDEGLPYEELRMAVVLAGARPGWLERPSPLDVWDAKGYATAIVGRLAAARVEVVSAPGAELPHLHPRGAAFIELAGKRIGSLGPLHPDVADALALGGEILVIELSLEPFLAGAATPRYVAIPRYPAATRDVALVVDERTTAGQVERAVREAAGPLAEDVQLFDRFTGGQVPKGHASLAFHVVYRAKDRTLTDAEVDAAHANVVQETHAKLGATLRS